MLQLESTRGRRPLTSLTLFLILTFATQSSSTAAQEIVHIRVENLPGRLESFLFATPNVSVGKEVMGTLDSPGKATFTTMIATNPASKAQEKGPRSSIGARRLKGGDLFGPGLSAAFALVSGVFQAGDQRCDGSPSASYDGLQRLTGFARNRRESGYP